jgi:hypothetical protein
VHLKSLLLNAYVLYYAVFLSHFSAQLIHFKSEVGLLVQGLVAELLKFPLPLTQLGLCLPMSLLLYAEVVLEDFNIVREGVQGLLRFLQLICQENLNIPQDLELGIGIFTLGLVLEGL